MNVNFTGRNKYDSFLLKNYYFKNFININNIKELYTSFLNYENINNLKSNIKIKKETNFLFFEDLNNKLIVSKHADGCGVFSKKFTLPTIKKAESGNTNMGASQNLMEAAIRIPATENMRAKACPFFCHATTPYTYRAIANKTMGSLPNVDDHIKSVGVSAKT